MVGSTGSFRSKSGGDSGLSLGSAEAAVGASSLPLCGQIMIADQGLGPGKLPGTAAARKMIGGPRKEGCPGAGCPDAIFRALPKYRSRSSTGGGLLPWLSDADPGPPIRLGGHIHPGCRLWVDLAEGSGK